MSKIDKSAEIILYRILLSPRDTITTIIINKRDSHIIGGGKYRPVSSISSNWLTPEEYFEQLGSKIECLK